MIKLVYIKIYIIYIRSAPGGFKGSMRVPEKFSSHWEILNC